MQFLERGREILPLLVIGLLAAAPAGAVVTAVRIQDLDLRDPHTWINALGCRDLTDATFAGFSFNGNLQTRIQTDGNGDGLLDLSHILLFNDLNPSASAGSLKFGTVDCTAPMSSTACHPRSGSTFTSLSTTQSGAGTCLTTIAGTVRPYSPAVTASTSPCFVTPAATIVLDLSDIPVTLHDAQIAGTFVGSPVTGIANGLLRGFLTEADANATVFPASMPVIGGKPFSSVLRGGTGCCATGTDKDTDGVTGWWIYLNYTGQVVPWSDPTVSVPEAPAWAGDVRVTPNPSGGRVDVSFALDRAGDVRLAIYDLQGRLVRDLIDGRLDAGEQHLMWNGRQADGTPASPGLYVLAMNRGGRTFTRHVALVR